MFEVCSFITKGEIVNVGSLFSGIGGFDLGFEAEGFRTAWFVEWEPYCQAVLRKRWPGVPVFGDIKAVDFREQPRVDVLIGGFPCQPFSHAGKRKGTADERWLWPEFKRAIQEARPTWVVIENVPGLISMDNGAVLGSILDDLRSEGYTPLRPVLIEAASVGAPHKRERIFIVARKIVSLSLLADSDSQRSLHREPHEQPAEARKQTLSELIADSSLAYADGSGCGERWGSIANEEEYSSAQCGCEARQWACSRSCEDRRLAFAGVRRVSHGVSNRVDRIKSLGNAVVPQVAREVAKAIKAVEEERMMAVSSEEVK